MASFEDFLSGLGDVATDPSVWAGILGAFSTQDGQDSVTKPYFTQGAEQGLAEANQAAREDFYQGPDQYYQGQKVAGLDPNTIAGQNNQLSQIDRMNQLATQGGQSALTLAQGGVAPVEGFQLEDQIGFGLPEEYQQAIMNPIMKQLTEKTIPGLHQAATASGAFGGTRMQQQKADAATQATDALIRGNLQARQQSIGQRAGDISALLSGRGQDIQQGQIANQAMQAGMNGIAGVQQNLLAPGSAQTQIGNARQAYEQLLRDADFNQWNWQNTENNNWINRLYDRMRGGMTQGTVQEGFNATPMDYFNNFQSGATLYNNIFNPAPSTGTQQTAPQQPVNP